MFLNNKIITAVKFRFFIMRPFFKIKKTVLLFAILAPLFTTTASAEKTIRQVFGDWHVVTLEEKQNNKKVCYIIALPKKSDGNIKVRGTSYIAVSAFNNRNPEISISSGYNFKSGASIELTVDSKDKHVVNQVVGDVAWLKSADLDLQVTSLMKSGKIVDVKATSNTGKYTIDQYSLLGFSKAYNFMNKLCSNQAANNKSVRTN